ncbi:MAG: [protein-PII] uridylyltransferase [Opitutales bacterium]|nr:[protein-PII] uridylyltransferase [Opitutales bacterium]
MATTHSTSKRIRSRADKQLQFNGKTTEESKLAAYRDFLKTETADIKKQHREGASGLGVTKMLTAVVDILIQKLATPAFETYRRQEENKGISIALVAIGGYGRSELCPLSDVDLMFLYPTKTNPKILEATQEFMVQQILYPLWDTGLKVGHSSRTIDDTFNEARNDIQTKTALLESRLIYGSKPLFEGFENSYNLFYRKENPKAYIQQRLIDQSERRARYGDTVFMQEPDIKNGVGGLRDYHNTLWMARVRLNVDSIDGLAEQKYLRKSELSVLKNAYDFLLRTRNELHFRSKRPIDLLSLETQPKVAYRIGYRERNILKRVELFMRDYYRHAESINRLSKTVESRMALNSQTEERSNPLTSMKNFLIARRQERVKQVDGFLIRGREIRFETSEVFIEDPIRLIRIFRHTQQNDLEIDLDLSDLIRGSIDLIDKTVINSPDANLSFRTILQETGNVYGTLEKMHQHGVLGKFVPEWDRLTCLVQHEYYHRYTADIHTLHTIRELDNIFADPDPIFERYRRELHELHLPNLLYLILFLHDIGKGEAIKGHAENGITLAEPILERMQINEKNRILIRFTIKNHLQMARFWQRYDIDDPDTVRVFTEQMETTEQLRLLYVHTFCDARGTAKGLWNQYKDTLHSNLFRRAMDSFNAEGNSKEQFAQHKTATLKKVLEAEEPQIGPEEINAHFQQLPDRYFINTSRDEIIQHIRMINQLLQGLATAESVEALAPIIDWKEDINRSFTVVNIVTWDRSGLFHKLAGSLNIAGYSILSAKAVSREDDIAIDTFYVKASDQKSRTVGDATMIFEECVKDALIAQSDLYPVLQNIMTKASDDIFYKNTNPLAQSFQTHVEIVQDQDLNRTILEIQAPDHLGLVYSIAKCVFDHGFEITFARINTERGIGIDTLYLDSADPEKKVDNETLGTLKKKILETISKESRPLEN